MLQAIRERAQGVMAWVILILITVLFALWGIQNYLGGGKEKPVAVVGDQEFYQRDVNRAYEQARRTVSRPDVDEKLLREQAFRKLIRDAVLSDAVADAGFVATDDMVRNFIQSLSYFQVDGQFDKALYENMLASQGMTSNQFAEKIRRALEMQQFENGIAGSDFATPYEVDRLFRLQNQKREAAYAVVSMGDPAAVSVSDAEIQAYYQDHQDVFKIPERVSVAYLELSLEGLAEKVAAPEEALRAFYEEQKELYSTKERRKVSHILVAVPADADEAAEKEALKRTQEIAQRLQKEDFAAVAKDVSDDPMSGKKGGDLGLISKGVMDPAFEEAAFALEEGNVSDPVRTPFGYHLIKVTELEPATVKSFESVRDELLDAYRRNQAENQFYELGERLAEMTYEHPDNLASAAEALGLEVKETGIFTRDYGEGIAAEEAVRAAAFSDDVRAGNNSEPVEIGSERVVVVRPLKNLPAEVQPFDEVRDEIVAILQREKAAAEAQKVAAELLDAVNKGASLEQAASARDLEVKIPGFVTRAASELPREITQAVFQAPRPQGGAGTAVRVALANGDQAVVQVMAVKEEGAAEVEAEKRSATEKSLARLKGRGVFDAVATLLEADADVTLHRDNADVGDGI